MNSRVGQEGTLDEPAARLATLLMRLNRQTLRDDRQQKTHVRVVSVGNRLRFDKDQRAVIKAVDKLVTAREAARPFHFISVSLVLLCMAALMGVITVGMFMDRLVSPVWSIVLAFTTTGLAALALAMPFATLRRLRELEAQRRSLPKLCPQCLYELHGLPAEDDGCVVCPECGAAWRFDVVS